MTKAFMSLLAISCTLLSQNLILHKDGHADFGPNHLIRSINTCFWNDAWKSVSPKNGAKESVATTTYTLDSPEGIAQALQYTVSTATSRGRQQLRFQLSPQKDLAGRGCFICVHLNLDKAIGRTFIPVPANKPFIIPQIENQASLFSSPSLGMAVRLDNGKYFYISSLKRDILLVQDNRKFTTNSIEVRFLLASGGVKKGRTYMNTINFQTIDEAQLQAIIKQNNSHLVEQHDQLMWNYDKNGVGRLICNGTTYMTAELAVHGLNWSYNSQRQSDFDAVDFSENARFFSGDIIIPQTADVPLRVAKQVNSKANSVIAHYSLSIPQTIKMNGYQLSYNLQLPHYNNARIDVVTPQGPQTVTIPEILQEKVLLNVPVTTITVTPVGNVPQFKLSFNQPTELYIQDGRGWNGSNIELRMKFFRAENGETVGPVNFKRDVTMTASLNGKPMTTILNDANYDSITDTSAWFPCQLAWNAPSPIDVSFLNHTPAGKYGFIAVRGDQFVTTDNGQPIRFWGTCSSAGCNFPEKEQAPLIAKRIASYGLNIFRTHHADANWAERCFFDKKANNTRHFNTESLDRFDYFMYCLKQNGIYIYLDQLVNRTFKEGDGVDNAKELPVCAKPYCYFDRKLIELQKEYSKNLWSHVNPYTKLAYKDDPAVAMMEFCNENDFYSQPVVIEPYRTRFEDMYRAWAKEQNITLPAEKIDFTVRTDSLVRFYVHVTDAYYREMGDFLRNEVGVKVPMTGSNWTRSSSLLSSLAKLDYTDSHSYWNHPAKDGSFNTSSMLSSQNTIMDGLSFQKVSGKPFFVSEWDAPWPYEFRAELPVWIAAVSSFQNWNGLTVYTYRHSSVNTETINGAFETFNDPSRFGLFPAASLIYRRGDVAIGNTVKQLALNPKLVPTTKAQEGWNFPARTAITNLYRTESVFTDTPSADMITSATQRFFDKQQIVSENKQISHDVDNRSLVINTPRSQAVSSFFQTISKLATDDMTVELSKQFATVVLCSFSDTPIRQSNQLFIIAVGRSENTDFIYSFMRNRAYNTGHAPIITDAIRAAITVRTDNPALKVYPVSPAGEKLPALASTYKDGVLSFKLTAPTIYYVLE